MFEPNSQNKNQAFTD